MMQKHKPSFFKIMHGDFRDQLRVPTGFAKNFHDPLPRKVVLQTSTRIPFVVNLKKVENKLVLTKGWKKFVEDNSVEFGNLLVLRLVGDSKFYVKIYSISGCEKDRNMGHNVAGECSTGTNKERSCSTEKMRRRPEALEEEGCEFQSDYPFFIRTLGSCYVKKGYLQLPISFASKYFPKFASYIWIVDSTGRKWFVKLSCKSSKPYICANWRTVVSENNLREGSRCVFELVDTKDIKLRLTVLDDVKPK